MNGYVEFASAKDADAVETARYLPGSMLTQPLR